LLSGPWNWVIGNLNLVAALEDKDYDLKYVCGEGTKKTNTKKICVNLRDLRATFPSPPPSFVMSSSLRDHTCLHT